MKTLDRPAMQTEQITVQVSPEVAKRWRNAPPEQRRRAEIALMYALMTREEVAAELSRFMDHLGEGAKARGWTDEMNEALLRGNYD